MIDHVLLVLLSLGNTLFSIRMFLVSKQTLKRAIEVENLRTEGRAYQEDTRTNSEEFSAYVERWYGDRDNWLRERMAETKLRANADYGKASRTESQVEE